MLCFPPLVSVSSPKQLSGIGLSAILMGIKGGEVMSNWIGEVAVPILIGVATLVAQFYFKWGPDVKEQKRQLRRGTWWLYNILFAGSQLFALCVIATKKGPVTGLELVWGLSTVGISVLYMTLLMLRHFVIDLFARYTAITCVVVDALGAVATGSRPSAETMERLRRMLYGSRDKEAGAT